jgi:hypothetical protein
MGLGAEEILLPKSQRTLDNERSDVWVLFFQQGLKKLKFE